MKALVCEKFGPVGDLVYRDIADPVPGPGEILIDVRAAGVNFADSLVVQGLYQAKPAFPFVPGSEAAGEVSALGSGVSEFKLGDRVLGFSEKFGGYAERMILSSAVASRVPDPLSFAQGAALLGATGTAHHALRQRANLQAGETLVVLGAAGGTGTAAVQIGKAIGARVIAVCSSAEKMAFAKAQGADECINYRTEDLRLAIKALTDDRGADVVYDAVGGDAFDACTRAMAWNGRLLVIGFASGRIPQLPVNLTLVKGYAVVGVFWGAFVQKEPHVHRQNMLELNEWISRGLVVPVVDAIFPLADAVAALNKVAGRDVIGKVVMQP